MFFILSKIFSFFCQPIVWIFALLVWGLFAKKQVKKKKLYIAATALLFLFSNQALFHEFSAAWDVKRVPIEALDEEYEVAVILGGIISIDEENKDIEFNSNADRFLQILPLYFSGRVKKILLSGGSGKLLSEARESDYLKAYLINIGVKKEDLWVENRSRNTYENAKYSMELLDKKQLEGKILLCTSASHMKRSLACFLKQGAEVQVYPVDHVSLTRELNPESLLVPKAHILSNWYHLIHEWLGIISYKLAGYC